MPCDLFVYDFRTILGIVDGYGIRRICLHCIRAKCDFLYGLSATDRDKAIRRPCGDRTEIMQSSCSLCSLRQKSYGAHAASVRRPRGDGRVIVRSSSTYGHSCTKSVQLHISACVVG